jgi:hypothetical protein
MPEKFIIINSGDTAATAQVTEAVPIESGGHSLASVEEAIGGMSSKFTLSVSDTMPDGGADLY